MFQTHTDQLSDAANLIETNLVLLGATAIEESSRWQVGRCSRDDL